MHNPQQVEEKRNGKHGLQLSAYGIPVIPNLETRSGWRAGKPEEDPEKMKKWGYVSAKPSEFLVRMRGGKVISSGQGASCFKWPWDSVAIVPTTVQTLHFTADQITNEKVGVKVTGIAVYRIADPLIAFRMLNFSYPERAQQKLSEMLEEMFIGAVRRLVANLTVEQCLTRRKDALGSELLREIAPVVSGTGRTEDRTQRGWGVVLDSIEIQDVRVMSAAVFANMQARFRQDSERMAREAELAKERAVKQDEANSERQIALTRLATTTEVRQQQTAAEENARLEKLATDARVEEARLKEERLQKAAQLAHARDLELRRVETERELKAQKAAVEEQLQLDALATEARYQQARVKAAADQAAAEEALKLQAMLAEQRLIEAKVRGGVEQARAQAETARAQHEAALAQESNTGELFGVQVQVAETKLRLAEVEARTMAVELHKRELIQKLELERQWQIRQIENTLSPEAIQLAVAHRLPELAAAFQQKMGEVHVTAVDGANPFGYIAAAVEGVMGLARSAGLKLPAIPAELKPE
ncbi:MAG: band 7 family protein [Myxococcaceae bacterium]|nr:band 7 family protein [Myxococcaceae bacterium]